MVRPKGSKARATKTGIGFKATQENIKVLPLCLGDEGPDFVDIDDGTVVVGGVVMLVEVPHTNLAEVTGMVLVEVDSEHRKKIY